MDHLEGSDLPKDSSKGSLRKKALRRLSLGLSNLASRSEAHHGRRGKELAENPKSVVASSTVEAGSLVTLTLFGKSAIKGSLMAQQAEGGSVGRLQAEIGPPLITSPLPVSQDKQQFSDNRLQTLNMMREREMQNIAKLNMDYSMNPSEKLEKDLESALKRVKHLQEQMMMLSELTRAGDHHSAIRPNNFADRPLPPVPMEAGVKPMGDFGRVSRKNSAVNNHSRQLSTPELSNVGGSMLTCPPDSLLLNKSCGELDTLDTDSINADVVSTIPLVTRKPPDGRLRTSSYSEKMLTPDTPVPPVPPPVGPKPFLNGPSGRTFSGSFPSLSPFSRPQQVDVITMDDPSFPSLPLNQRPFMQYSTLQRHLPHLSVFMLYLFNNSDPNSLLFHLLTEIYYKGAFKDLQRWSCEIHSLFTAAGSPLELGFIKKVPGISAAIEETLNKSEKDEEQLRNVFNNARIRAVDVIKVQLVEFQQKRVIGLSTMYGPSDAELDEAFCSSERTKEIVGDILGKWLEFITDAVQEDPEYRLDKQAAAGTALASFLKLYGGKTKEKDGISVVDRWPTMLQKDKTRFKPKDKLKKAASLAGHQLAPTTLNTLTSCGQCSSLMWGAGPQGYICTSCSLVLHRACAKLIEKHCTGKPPSRSSLVFPDMTFIRKRNNHSPGPAAVSKKMHEDDDSNQSPDMPTLDAAESEAGKRTPVVNSRGSASTPDVPDSNKSIGSATVIRSDSLKAQKRAGKSNPRKKSDPTYLDRNDDTDTRNGRLGTSESSSTSSHSLRSSESPRDSMDSVADSDFEADLEKIPDWTAEIEDIAVLESIDAKERKRQDVLAELFHTERTHVRNLKVLSQVFYIPMLKNQILSKDILHSIFANLENMKEIHSSFNRSMRRLKKTSQLIGNVGDLLLSRFEGAAGQQLKREAAAFCLNQHSGLEALKMRQKKDEKLAQFLLDAEKNPLCRRLQLKDLIPTGMQRLTKYPLLFEQLLKYTKDEDGGQEREKIMTALNNSKDTLDYVNQAVTESENKNRLKEIEEKTDASPYKKTLIKLSLDNKNFAFAKHKLLHDGDVTWRISKQKTVDLRLLLLEKEIVLITRQDEKLIFKFHSNPSVTAMEKRTSDVTRYWSPVLELENLILRDVATDKHAFHICGKGLIGGQMQMYELVASSGNDQHKWKRHIQQAIDGMTKLYETIPETFPVTATASVATSEFSPEHIGSPMVPSSDGNEDTEGQEDQSVTGEENSGQPDVPANDEAKETKRKRALSLMSPSAITVTRFEIHDAEVVLTPFEQLKRRDRQLEEAIADKMRLTSLILGTTKKESSLSSAPSTDGNSEDPKRLLFSSAQQIANLTNLLNTASAAHREQILLAERHASYSSDSAGSHRESSAQTEAEAPVVRVDELEDIALKLNRSLSTLMKVVCQREDENQRLKGELFHIKEQLRFLRLETRSPLNSRPSSFLSLSSTGSYPPDSLDGDTDHTVLDEDYQSIAIPSQRLGENSKR